MCVSKAKAISVWLIIIFWCNGLLNFGKILWVLRRRSLWRRRGQHCRRLRRRRQLRQQFFFHCHFFFLNFLFYVNKNKTEIFWQTFFLPKKCILRKDFFLPKHFSCQNFFWLKFDYIPRKSFWWFFLTLFCWQKKCNQPF